MGFFDSPVSTGSSGNFFTSPDTPSQPVAMSIKLPPVIAPTAQSTPVSVAPSSTGGFWSTALDTVKGLPAAAATVGNAFLGGVKDFATTIASQFTGQSTPAANTIGGIAANTWAGLLPATVKVGQGILSDTLGKLGVSVAQDIETIGNPSNKVALEDFTPKGPMAALLGNTSISGLSTDVASLEQAIKSNPIAQQWGLNKYALPLAFGGVIGEQTLNYAPFGGGEGEAVSALAKSTNIGEISGILQKIGVQADLIPQVAEKFAAMSKPEDIRAGLQMVENLQKTTKVADTLSSGIPKEEAPAGGVSIEGPAQTRAIPSAQQELPLREPQPAGQAENPTVAASSQDTTAKVDLTVRGEGTASRVTNAISNSESLKTQISNAGQDAYLAGKGLSQTDLGIIRDAYQSGSSIADVAAKTSNPTAVEQFLTKLQNYYDFQLAADRAAGGSTARVENYVPQIWDLSKPEDLAKFNQFAAQKGIKPYDGFSAQPRVFKSYAEGEAAGFKPKNDNILKDLEETYQAAAHGISRQALKQGLIQAAPNYLSIAGRGVTDGGRPFVNSNIQGLEGLSYHPEVGRLLKGYEPLRNPDFIALVKKAGATAAVDRSGLGGMIDRAVAAVKSIPENAKTSGPVGIMGSVWHNLSSPAKQLLWNFSGFHSFNITNNFIGASLLHPIDAAKGVTMSVAAAVSERVSQAVVKHFKETMYTDSEGAAHSVFDWAVKAGVQEAKRLAPEGFARFNPFTAGQRAIFEREIPSLGLQLAETFGASRGIVPNSPEGQALGREIRTILGEINPRTMNINPNNLRIASHLLLAPPFTASKAFTTLDALTKWSGENKAAGALARQAVIGKSVFIGTLATMVTLIATGKLPTIGQILLNYTINPSAQTNFTDPKGRKLDITFPKTFVSEWAGLLTNPVNYLENRLNPFLADGIKLYTNQDNIGRPIVDPNVPQSQAMQIAKNIGVGHLPIGMQAVVNQLLGKQTTPTTVVQIAGGNTRISASDPSKIKYAGIDKAQADISKIAPDDPERVSKMQAIFNSIPADDRKSLQYQELLSGVSTKGVYLSAVEQKYFQVQDLLAKGDTAGATAITSAMSKQDYSTYKSIKTRQADEKLFGQVQALVKSGDTAGATKLTEGMTKAQYKSYQTWKKNNP